MVGAETAGARGKELPHRTDESRSSPAAVLRPVSGHGYRRTGHRPVSAAAPHGKKASPKTINLEIGTLRAILRRFRVWANVEFWAGRFANRTGDDFVFPSERYGAGGNTFTPRIYETDPTKPIGDWKEAWESAKKRAGVRCRFHDLRHTGCTRMLEGGVPFATVAVVMGWSPAATVRMAKRYGHIGQASQRQAVTAINDTVLTRGPLRFPLT
jgi:integrase